MSSVHKNGNKYGNYLQNKNYSTLLTLTVLIGYHNSQLQFTSMSIFIAFSSIKRVRLEDISLNSDLSCNHCV